MTGGCLHPRSRMARPGIGGRVPRRLWKSTPSWPGFCPFKTVRYSTPTGSASQMLALGSLLGSPALQHSDISTPFLGRAPMSFVPCGLVLLVVFELGEE